MGERIEVFFTVYLLFFGLLMMIPVVFYILQSLGLYGMCKNTRMESPWLAWIPIGNLYCIGYLAEQSNLACGKKKGSLRILLPVLSVLLISFIPVFFIAIGIAAIVLEEQGIPEEAIIPFVLLMFFVIFVFSLLISVMGYVAYYKIFKLFAPDEAVIYLVLSIFVSPALPIVFFLLRNRIPPSYGNPFSRPVFNPPFYPTGQGTQDYQPPQGGNPPSEPPSPF